jgi:hypothetical protein
VREHLDDILLIVKLLSHSIKDDVTRTNVGMLYEKVLESFGMIHLRKT